MNPATDAGKKHLPTMYVDGLYDSIELCADPKRCVDRNAVHVLDGVKEVPAVV